MYNIGVDLGGTKIAVGIVDENNKILIKDKMPTLPERDSIEITKDMAALSEKLLAELGLTFKDVSNVGIATPGSINPIDKLILYANNLRMNKYPVAKDFSDITGFPIDKIFLENDANAAAFGEHVGGAAKGYSSSILITLGTGLGGGIILNGKIYAGFNYTGGELGHMVIEHNGRPCSCGRNGCWEAYSSATALVTATKRKMQSNTDSGMWDIAGNLQNVNARTAWDAMRSGDSAGKALVNEYIDYLACGITNIINIFQPEIFSIGGGISNEGDNLLRPLMKIVGCDQYGNDTTSPRTILKIAELKNDAGIVGSANLYLNYLD